jgi:REP element-mobilizing transposase RayT
MSHAKRPVHRKSYPVHVTLKAIRGVCSLRGHKLAPVIGRLFRRHVGRHPDFRVTHFSIQTTHLHLIVEAETSTALSRGLQGLISSLARTINARMERRGPLFVDRYHEHTLRSPPEVRHAVQYVLLNHARHGGDPGIDPWSSSAWFPHWRQVQAATVDCPVATPRTWLLRVGILQDHGPLDLHHVPGAR